MTEDLHPSLQEGNVNPDEDRYPTLKAVLSRILAESDLLDIPVGRVELNLFASGEATYRVWEPRAEEPEGGYFAGIE